MEKSTYPEAPFQLLEGQLTDSCALLMYLSTCYVQALPFQFSSLIKCTRMPGPESIRIVWQSTFAVLWKCLSVQFLKVFRAPVLHRHVCDADR